MWLGVMCRKTDCEYMAINNEQVRSVCACIVCRHSPLPVSIPPSLLTSSHIQQRHRHKHLIVATFLQKVSAYLPTENLDKLLQMEQDPWCGACVAVKH